MRPSLRSLVLVAALALPIVFAGACAEILGIRSDARPPRFPHRAHVLEGIACTRCHQNMDVAVDRGPLHVPGDRDCISCHSPPHEPRDCLRCHGSDHERGRAELAREHLRFRHDQHLARRPASCVRCHAGVGAPSEDMIVPMARCLSCHEHRDTFASRRCADCHVDLPEEAITPSDHLIHDDDFLARHGTAAASAADLCVTCHEESSCASCHGSTVPALSSAIRFDRATATGMHRAGFFARHAEAARADAALCTSCHAPSTCASCHLDRGVAPRPEGTVEATRVRNPHPPGWVGPLATDNQHGPAARRDPAACASCHGGAGESLCVGCHRVGGVGGSIHPAGFESRLGMDDAPCRFCHGAAP